MKRQMIIVACALLAAAGLVQAQQTTTTLKVQVGPEASLTVTNPETDLTTASTAFGDPFTGITNLTYMIRTSQNSGTGSISVTITSDFAPGGGPSVTSPLTGDELTYGCTVSSPGTGCTGTPKASASVATAVAGFGANAKSAKGGNSASVNWSLPDDPAYPTATYSATATFSISAT